MATYFWVGGNGTWDNSSTANWSNVSGGSAGFGPPTSADSVKFDSGSGSGTCTTASTAAASIISLDNVNVTLSLGDNLTISSSFTLNQGTLALTGNSGNWTLTCSLLQSLNNTTRTINFGTGNITLTGNNTTIWQVNFLTGFSYTGTPTVNSTYAGSTGTRRITHGYGATAPQETTAVSFNISAGSDIVVFAVDGNNFVKNLDFTGFAGTFTVGFGNYIYGNLITSSNTTYSASSRPVIFGATSGTQQITTAGKTLGFPITFNGVGGTFAFQDALTQGSTRAFTLTNGTLQLKDGVTSTVGSFATSGTNQKYLQSTLAGTQATISQTSGTLNLQYLTVKDINATGGAKWNAVNNSFTQGNNTGWYFAAQLGKPIPAFAF
jgi:hypothetical protein